MLVIKLDTAGRLFKALQEANREFSYSACKALVDFYNELEEDFEFNPIVISCDWNEVTADQAERETGLALSDLHEHTTVYELDNGNVLYLNFYFSNITP